MSYAAMAAVRGSGLEDATLVDVLEALAFFMNDQSGKCCPSTETIARIARRSPNVTRQAIKKLEAKGFIAVRQSPGRERHFKLFLDRLPKAEPLSEVEGVAEVKPLSEVEGDPFQKCEAPPFRSERGPLSEVKPEQVSEQVNEQVSEQGSNSQIPGLACSVPVKPKRKRRTPVAKPTELTDQTWRDWNDQRNAKHAPISETVVKKFRTEAEKAGISLEEAVQYSIFRGWQGFQADWYLKNLAKERTASPNRPLQREDMVYTDDF